MIYIGTPPDPAPPKRPAAPPPPFACIRKTALDTYCYRTASANEFLFTDPKHAVGHYLNGKSLAVCTSCAACATEAIAKEEASMGVKLT